jgi:putative two-component system response regulator
VSMSMNFGSKRSVLVVDDAPDNLSLLFDLLKNEYKVLLANNGEKALQIARSANRPDLILLDIMMPGLSGYEVCQTLKGEPATRYIPIIFLSAMDSPEEEEMGFALGAEDFIRKPVNPHILKVRVAAQMRLKAAADFLVDQNAYLEAEVQRRGREVAAIQDVTIMALSSLAETRDSDTGNHIRRTQNYLAALGEQLRHHPRFHHLLDEEFISLVYRTAPLHDIGKAGIPDRILTHTGKLETEDFEIMKGHCQLGVDAIEHAERQLDTTVDFLKVAKEIAYGHHERWDGSGYPQGLAGDAIPVAARMMALADVYDTLISRRPYKEAMPHEQAIEIIRQGRGTHFDPDMTDMFLEIADSIEAIARRFADSDEDLARKAQALAKFMG